MGDHKGFWERDDVFPAQPGLGEVNEGGCLKAKIMEGNTPP